MSKRNLSLDALKSHLFEAIESVKNINDSEASENEKLSLDQARTIVDLSGRIIEVYKVQVDAFKTIERMSDVGKAQIYLGNAGIIDAGTMVDDTKRLQQ